MCWETHRQKKRQAVFTPQGPLAGGKTYEGCSKNFHIFIFPLESLKAGGVLIVCVQGCNTMSKGVHDDVKGVVHHRLHAQPRTFFANSIKKLVPSWENCIAKEGDYVENVILK